VGAHTRCFGKTRYKVLPRLSSYPRLRESHLHWPHLPNELPS
jgi:hypothetical protein